MIKIIKKSNKNDISIKTVKKRIKWKKIIMMIGFINTIDIMKIKNQYKY